MTNAKLQSRFIVEDAIAQPDKPVLVLSFSPKGSEDEGARKLIKNCSNWLRVMEVPFQVKGNIIEIEGGGKIEIELG